MVHQKVTSAIAALVVLKHCSTLNTDVKVETLCYGVQGLSEHCTAANKMLPACKGLGSCDEHKQTVILWVPGVCRSLYNAAIAGGMVWMCGHWTCQVNLVGTCLILPAKLCVTARLLCE